MESELKSLPRIEESQPAMVDKDMKRCFGIKSSPLKAMCYSIYFIFLISSGL